MQYFNLDESLRASRLCFGCEPLGGADWGDDVDVNEHEHTVDGSQIGYSNLQGTYELSAYALAVQLTKSF